jgi:hypothetical protein
MTYIGNEMGMKNIKQAKNYALAGVGIFLLFTLLFIGTL